MSEILDRLDKVARSLPDTIGRLVFVGGGVTELLVTDSAGRKPRPTEDIDCIIEVASLLEYNQFEKILRKSGFCHDSNIPPLICRWEKEDVVLDVMPPLKLYLDLRIAGIKRPFCILFHSPSQAVEL